MKKMIALVAMLTLSIGFAGNAGAGKGASGEAGLAERHGAHWARVSDKAQIELIIDELRDRVREGARGKIAQKQLSDALEIQPQNADARPVSGGYAPQIEITGTTARVMFETGGELEFRKIDNVWRVIGSRGALSQTRTGDDRASVLNSQTGVSVGETFVHTPVSRELDIDRLSRGVTKSKLNRALFGTLGKTASYYSAHYTSTAPYVSATYLQFIVDPEWNRIVYGNMNRWIKSYDRVRGPSGIAVDPDGRVFVSETGESRVLALKITGEEQDAQLLPLFEVSPITNPSDIALSDNGTPLDTRDDILYVADAVENTILKYALLPSGATLVATHTGFDSPTSIHVGRWNGANNELIYVVDNLARRVRLYEDMGAQLSLLQELRGGYDQYFSSITSDHFGNIYLVDNIHSRVSKYTSSLEILDTHGGREAFTSLGAVEIPFGKITIDGQGTYWAGFDQMFALERWADNSGAQRRTLGLAMKNLVFSGDADVAVVENVFTLTDFADVRIQIYDSANRLVRGLTDSWMVSGGKSIQWNRRDDQGRQVRPGTYRYEIDAQSAYADIPVVSRTQFYLPLYYWENSGSPNQLEDEHVLQGQSTRWGTGPSETTNEHASSVQYRFAGLNPASEYMVAAEYVSHDGLRRLQDMTVNGVRIHEPLAVTDVPTKVEFIKLGKDMYASGEITININKRAEGSAIISQLWLKESGVGFNVEQINGEVPTAFSLNQNYPNPFNPSTIIRYAIPEDGNVSLKVFDITGREVATLVNEYKRAGSYEVRFDTGISLGGRSLASGVYLYRLQAGGFSSAKKMVILK